jgi:hypothetical protein
MEYLGWHGLDIRWRPENRQPFEYLPGSLADIRFEPPVEHRFELPVELRSGRILVHLRLDLRAPVAIQRHRLNSALAWRDSRAVKGDGL